MTVGGQDFFIEPTTVPPTTPVANYIHLKTDTLPSASDAAYLGETFSAIDSPYVPVDWDSFSAPEVNLASSDDFVLLPDTGANVGISPYRDDFYDFTPINPRPVKGFQGSSISATGVGTIITDKLFARRVLYVPTASVRLLSVSSLCRDEGYTCHFDDARVWITAKDGRTVCDGALDEQRHLYRLNCRLVRNPNSPMVNTARTVDSWHLRLRHAHPQACVGLGTVP
ncbi:hypothetical protein C8F01DRAFT_1254081 [Mycena amicta]|nr:hypothetical protein C8F01DRAFT_1254081 [Mycena amicta]